LIAEVKNLNVIKENSLEESQEVPGSPGLPISTPVGDNGSLGSSYEGVIVESKEPKPEYKESKPVRKGEEKDNSAGDEEGKMIDPWVGLLTLKEKIKTHTEDPIENTINQFLNQNLDETELDYILKIKTSDAYKKNLDWPSKGISLAMAKDPEDRNVYKRRMLDFTEHQFRLQEMMALKESVS
jgi:hypothetical protein